MEDKRQEYINFLNHMKDDYKKIKISFINIYIFFWLINDATEKDKLFTRNELADMFPDLLGHIREN